VSYSVFLVEDEVVVRESIRDSVPWAGSGFHLAGEAADGEMALPLIQDLKPDILITDIKMPFMDGLELARIVRRNLPWVKIIILSGHDEFSFAREAISLAVTDYLLKPLSAADLLATLRRVAGQIEAENAAREKIENLNRSLATGLQLMAERFLNDLATGLVPPGEALRRAGELGLALTARCYIVASLTPRVRPGGDASSQFPAGILQSAPLLARTQELTIEVEGELISKPYIELSIALMQRFGVEVERAVTASGLPRFTVAAGAHYRAPGTFAVEGDASSASYFLALGALAGDLLIFKFVKFSFNNFCKGHVSDQLSLFCHQRAGNLTAGDRSSDTFLCSPS